MTPDAARRPSRSSPGPVCAASGCSTPAGAPPAGHIPSRSTPVDPRRQSASDVRAHAPSTTVGRDLGLPALVAIWVVVALGLDRGASLGEQQLIGLGTWLLLMVLLRGEQMITRLQVAVVVVYATAVEYVFSDWLGAYAYRLDNVPAFVPPGHGLVYLAALCLGRSELVQQHAQLIVRVALVGVSSYAGWSLLLAPRTDVVGAFWAACLAAFLLRGRAPLVYAGAAAVVTYLELVGTSLGTWAWATHDPVLGVVAMGNPPSGVAGAYCYLDAAALAIAPLLLRIAPVSPYWRRREVGLPLRGQDSRASDDCIRTHADGRRSDRARRAWHARS